MANTRILGGTMSPDARDNLISEISEMLSQDVLKHYGKKGMKWGVITWMKERISRIKRRLAEKKLRKKEIEPTDVTKDSEYRRRVDEINSRLSKSSKEDKRNRAEERAAKRDIKRDRERAPNKAQKKMDLDEADKKPTESKKEVPPQVHNPQNGGRSETASLLERMRMENRLMELSRSPNLDRKQRRLLSKVFGKANMLDDNSLRDVVREYQEKNDLNFELSRRHRSRDDLIKSISKIGLGFAAKSYLGDRSGGSLSKILNTVIDGRNKPTDLRRNELITALVSEAANRKLTKIRRKEGKNINKDRGDHIIDMLIELIKKKR